MNIYETMKEPAQHLRMHEEIAAPEVMVTIERDRYGNYVFYGNFKWKFIGYTLKECKRLYKEKAAKRGEAQNTKFVWLII